MQPFFLAASEYFVCRKFASGEFSTDEIFRSRCCRDHQIDPH